MAHYIVTVLSRLCLRSLVEVQKVLLVGRKSFVVMVLVGFWHGAGWTFIMGLLGVCWR